LLYNSYVLSDPRQISATGWHVPSDTELTILVNTLGGLTVAGGHLKDTGTLYWASPNTGADDSSGFTGRGSGVRYNSIGGGTFSDLLGTLYLWSTTAIDAARNWIYSVSYNSASVTRQGGVVQAGFSIRLLKDDSNFTSTYTGNDGKVYLCVQIGTQIWLAENLLETRYRDNSLVSYVGANGINYTNTEWEALTTEALCPYNNTWSNAGCGATLLAMPYSCVTAFSAIEIPNPNNVTVTFVTVGINVPSTYCSITYGSQGTTTSLSVTAAIGTNLTTNGAALNSATFVGWSATSSYNDLIQTASTFNVTATQTVTYYAIVSGSTAIVDIFCYYPATISNLDNICSSCTTISTVYFKPSEYNVNKYYYPTHWYSDSACTILVPDGYYYQNGSFTLANGEVVEYQTTPVWAVTSGQVTGFRFCGSNPTENETC
jgi:uncharacterized protein (TIGR02145 family)